ncbi:MAG: hypothetical protein QXH56_04855 [Thermoprotei archaeon]
MWAGLGLTKYSREAFSKHGVFGCAAIISGVSNALLVFIADFLLGTTYKWNIPV